MNDTMTIGALARAAGVNVETVRYYQRRGLVPEPERPYGGVRRYDDRALARLHFIRSAQWLGFSLKEVEELLKLDDGTHCDEARALGESKLAEVRAKIRGLRQIEGTLDELVRACRGQYSVACPMIASLYRQAESPREEAVKRES